MIDAYPAARERVPDLRMKVVCGPRIDPASMAAPEGVELVGYVHDLSRELAACDVAVTQGGLTTCMELAAAKRPFLYFPLDRHFEQNLHVRHRLERYGAGRDDRLRRRPRRSRSPTGSPPPSRRREPADVERDGAARAAAADRRAALVVVVDRAHAEREHQPAEHDHDARSRAGSSLQSRSCRISERSASIT